MSSILYKAFQFTQCLLLLCRVPSQTGQNTEPPSLSAIDTSPLQRIEILSGGGEVPSQEVGMCP